MNVIIRRLHLSLYLRIQCRHKPLPSKPKCSLVLHQRLPKFLLHLEHHQLRNQNYLSNIRSLVTHQAMLNRILQNLLVMRSVNFETEDAIAFWQRLIAAKTLNKLQSAALRVLSIPASSSPVERVFSHGGIIMRPHPARLSDSKLSKLIFLKCNGSATE